MDNQMSKAAQIEAAWAAHMGTICTEPSPASVSVRVPVKTGKVIFANREEINACWLAYAQRKKMAEAQRKTRQFADGKFHNLADLQASLAKPKRRVA